MNILFTIPHYFQPTAEGKHSSLRPDAGFRAEALASLVLSLHENFGCNQFTVDLSRPAMRRNVNLSERNHVNIIIITLGDNHVLSHISRLSHLFAHHTVTDPEYDPRFLGVKCREVLRELYFGKPNYFDFYCFLEDDTLIHDPLFFEKLMLFTAHFGNERLLLPNRYEVESTGFYFDKRPMETRIGIKLYCDGEIDPELTKGYPLGANANAPERLEMQVGGKTIRFRRPTNPHCGGYFLNAEQMRMFMETPYFLEKSAEFVGPLESSATLGIMKRFAIYKPDFDNANFFEMQHYHARLLNHVKVRRIPK